MLIFRDTSPETYEAMSRQQREECLQEWNDWYDGLAAMGKVQHGHPLAPAGRTVTADRVIDGPFAEAKEAIGGYFFLRVADLEEATAIAQRCPNLKHGMTVEVRPVSEACPLARSLGRETMGGSRTSR